MPSAPEDPNRRVPKEPTAHDVVERERLIRSRDYAREMLARPGLVEEARDLLSTAVRNGSDTLGHRLWLRILDEELDEVVLFMTGDHAEGRLLRSSNPFSRLIGEPHPSRRRQTWLQARSELSPSRT